MRMLETHRRTGEVPGADELAGAARAVDTDALELIGNEFCFEPDREPLAAAMADAVSGEKAAVPLYLQSRAAEGRGDAAAQMDLLEAAVAADADLDCALVDLADLCSVAGDAHAANRLYQQAGVEPAYPGLTILRRFLPAAEGEVGRNRPCPCGSGKKYKVCHGREVPHPFPLRADWLWTKLVTFALRARQRSAVMDYAAILVGREATAQEEMIAMLTDGLAHDLALFDDGVLDQFLDELGSLLPDDERDLANQWLDSDRRLLEVVAVRPLRGLRCRDLVTGEELEILDRTMPAQLEPLDLIFCRPLPDGAGGLRVRDAPRLLPRMMRSRLVNLLHEQAPGDQIATFFAPSDQLPELRTSEGEELVVCTARYDVDDADVVWARLVERGLEESGDDQLTQTTEIHGRGNVIRGTITRRSGRIVLETNAVERLRRLQTLLRDVDPRARLVDESTIPAERMLAEQQGVGADVHPGPESQVPPEVEEAALKEMMRRHEETWPDIELPALGGRTPRQAAADPQFRPDLEALLDDFAWHQRRQPDGPQMDLDRLRSDLGLAPARH